MFNFFRKKSQKEIEQAKNFKEAIKTIKFFIAILDWEKAQKAIDEIKQKELYAYKEITENIDLDYKSEGVKKQKEKINKIYSEKQNTLTKLENYLKEKKQQHDDKQRKKQFNIHFKLLKKEINQLIHTSHIHQAKQLLKQFLNENKGNTTAIKYYNKINKKLLKLTIKEKQQNKKKGQEKARLKALKFFGNTINEGQQKEHKKNNIFSKIKEKLNFYTLMKKKIKEKKLLEDIQILLNEEDKIKNQLAQTKLENIHKGLIKEIHEDIIGYEFYGKILGAHKISGDTFGFKETKKKYTFFIGDATGHGIRAGFIITLITRLFNNFVEKKSFKDLIFEINNALKQDLKSMNFITSIFFEIAKNNLNYINYIGLGHEPILLYRQNTKTIETYRPGGLAAGIRIIKDKNNIKTKTLKLQDGDILVTYSDGLLEAKSPNGEYYGINKLTNTLNNILKVTSNTTDIYNQIIKDVSDFRKGTSFEDDLSILILKRDTNGDIINNTNEFLEEIGEINNIKKKDIKKLKGKSKKEIMKELEILKKEKQKEIIIKKLKQLWLNGEILKLKEEAKRYIKEGFIDKQINYYLEKALEHQQQYKISLKEERLKNKYNTLKALLKKGDYNRVIEESHDIILKDGNI